MKFNIIDNSYQILVDFNGEYSMDELGTLDLMVLKFVKKDKPTIEQFEIFVNQTSYAFDDMHDDYVSEYGDRKLVAINYNFKDNGDIGNAFVFLTAYGETILKNSQRQNNKEWIQIIAPVGALIITTITLVFSIVIGF